MKREMARSSAYPGKNIVGLRKSKQTRDGGVDVLCVTFVRNKDGVFEML
jgi:hypothetical protein